MSQLLQELEHKPSADLPFFEVGDTISVHQRIAVEAEKGKKNKKEEKERIQVLTGTVIAKKPRSFSVLRVAYGESVEKTFPYGPLISKIEVVRKGKVRRSKLYYLRGRSGKALRVKERMMPRKSKTPAA